MTKTSALKLTVGGLLALVAAMGIGRFIYTPILPHMAAGEQLSASETGLIASANFAGYLLGAVGAAIPALARRPRVWLLAGLGVSVATTLATGLVDGMPAFLAVRFVAGVASALALVFVSAIVLERLAGSGHAGLSAVLFSGVGVGIALSALTISSSHALGGGWRADWIAGGVIALAAAAMVPMLIPGAGPVAAPATPASRPPDRTLLRLIAAYGLYGFGYVITMTFLVAIVRGAPDLAPLETTVWVVVGLSAAPSIAVWQWAGRRLGQMRALSLACAIEAVGVTLSVADASIVPVLAAAFLLGGTFISIAALGLTAARQVTRGDPTRAVALMTASFGAGQIIGPAFAGLLGDWTGSFLIPSLVAAAALLLAALITAGPAARAA